MLVVGAVAARLALLIFRPLWQDELFTVWAARLPARGLIRALTADSGPPLFYWLAKPFVSLAESLSLPDWIARAPSWIAALLLLLACRSLADRRSRGFFLLLWAISPLLLVYSAEARAYEVLGLLSLGMFLAATGGAQTPRRAACLAVLTAACLYTHYLAFFLVGALALLLVARRRFVLLAALGAGCVAFLPWVQVLVRQPGEALLWSRESVATSGVGFLSALGGAGRLPSPFGPALPGAIVAASFAAGLFLLGALGRLARSQPDVRDAVLVVFLTLSGTLVASFWRPIAFAGRTEMVILPIWIWAIAAGAGKDPGARLGASIAATIALVSTVLVSIHFPRQTPSAEIALREIEAVARTRDVLVAGPNFYLPARLDSDRGRFPGRLEAFPSALAAHPGWFLPGPPTRSDTAAAVGALEASQPNGRGFLLLHPYYWTPELADSLGARGRLVTLGRGPDVIALGWFPGVKSLATLPPPSGFRPPP